MKNIELKNLQKTYGEKTVLRQFSATFPAGKVTALMGPSGCGKTTLLRLLAGLESPDGGTVENRPQAVSFVFQEDRLCEDFSPIANVRWVQEKPMSRAAVAAVLQALGLDEKPEVPVKTMSGGMKRRVAIARAICQPFDLLLLDEPFVGLDGERKRSVMTYVKEKAAGKTVILVTHDPEEAAYFADQTVTM